MTPLVHEHTTCRCCCRRRICRDGSAAGLRTTGWGRRLGGRVGQRTAALKQFCVRRYPGSLWR